MKGDFVLYTYFRSSAAFRVRIALNLKNIKPEFRFVHLLRDGGAQHAADYKTVNPQELVPALVHDGHTITQSLAIIEYLDEVVPVPPLLPRDPLGRAQVRAMALAIACDIHPLNNLRVLQYLKGTFHCDADALGIWQTNWMQKGLAALEAMVASSEARGAYCYGDTPTLADICLVPQLANARRIELDLSSYPTLTQIETTALAHPAFEAAQPKNQPDAE